jgi:mannosyltransferase
MFFALAIASHAVAALVLRRRVLATFLTSAIAAAVVLPFLLASTKQTAQVAWIQDRSLIQNLTVAAVKQYFYGDDRPTGNLPPQWVLAVVVVLAVTQLALIALGVAYAARSADLRTLSLVCLSGVVIPMGGLLFISIVAQPVYVARYLTFTAPAFCAACRRRTGKVAAAGRTSAAPRPAASHRSGSRHRGEPGAAVDVKELHQSARRY